jgi:hypothetical protein
LSERVGKVVGYPPLSELGELQRREFQEALLDAASFEDLARQVAGGHLCRLQPSRVRGTV